MWSEQDVLVGFELPETGFALHLQDGPDSEAPPVSLDEAKRSVDFLADNGIGNLVAVRAYRMQSGPQGYFAQMKTPLPVDSDGFRLIEYAIRRGLHVITIYTNFSDEAARRLTSPDMADRFWPNLGERTNPAPAILDWYKNRKTPPTRGEAKEEAVRFLRDEPDHHGRPGVAHYFKQGFTRVGSVVIFPLDARYIFEAGVNVPMAETMVYSVDNQLSVLRGAARARGLEPLGVWIAGGWYGPSNYQPYKADVFRMALYHAFMYGCRQFVLETPALGSIECGEYKKDPDDPLARGHTDLLKEFFAFAREQPRPTNFPDVGIGLLRGQYDNFALTGSSRTTQFANPDWPVTDAERMWGHLRLFFPQQSDTPWQDDEHAWFSGTPFGPVDMVPIEAPVEHLLRYPTLALLGHNTMDKAMYVHLRAYVEGGGTLLLCGAHMQGDSGEWFRQGDWRDFPGVACRPPQQKSMYPERAAYAPVATIVDDGDIGLPRGRRFVCHSEDHSGCRVQLADDVRVLARSERGIPVMTLRRIGKGRVFCHSLLKWPAFGHLAALYRSVMGRLAERARPPFRLEGHTTTQYASGGDPDGRMLMALNTSLSRRDVFDVCLDGAWRHEMSLAPGEFALLCAGGPFLVRPEGTGLRIKGIEADDVSCTVTLSGQGYQRLHIVLAPERRLESFALAHGSASWRPMGWNWGVLGVRISGEDTLKLTCRRGAASWAPRPEDISAEFPLWSADHS